MTLQSLVQSSVQQQPSTKAGSPTTTVTPTTNTPTVTPTANMPTVTPVQTGPLATAAMQPGGLIDATRLMIDRHHKTMHQAFLAMDKARAASSRFAEHTRGLACCPGPDLPTVSQQPTTPRSRAYSIVPAIWYAPKPKPTAPHQSRPHGRKLTTLLAPTYTATGPQRTHRQG